MLANIDSGRTELAANCAGGAEWAFTFLGSPISLYMTALSHLASMSSLSLAITWSQQQVIITNISRLSQHYCQLFYCLYGVHADFWIMKEVKLDLSMLHKAGSSSGVTT